MQTRLTFAQAKQASKRSNNINSLHFSSFWFSRFYFYFFSRSWRPRGRASYKSLASKQSQLCWIIEWTLWIYNKIILLFSFTWFQEREMFLFLRKRLYYYSKYLPSAAAGHFTSYVRRGDILLIPLLVSLRELVSLWKLFFSPRLLSLRARSSPSPWINWSFMLYGSPQ